MKVTYFLGIIPFIGMLGAIPFVNRVEPYVLGMPFVLFWIVLWVVLCSVIMAIVNVLDAHSRKGEQE